MKPAFSIIFILISLFSAIQTFSQTTKKAVQNFTLTNTVDNSSVSLANFSSKKGVVVIFTSNFCPYSKLYEDRIASLASEYSAKGIQFLLINPNNPQASQDDSIEEMAKKARANGYKFPYLADKDQTVANMFGASKTPEVFVLKPNGTNFNIIYSGAIDDNPQVSSDVKSFYLQVALDNLLSGKSPTSAHERPTGCMIKKR